jgi:hypothetical protein
MRTRRKSSRYALFPSIACALILSSLAFTPFKVEGGKFTQTKSRRGVYLSGASLSPSRIAANADQPGALDTSATIEVTVGTTEDVTQGTIATVELLENSNFDEVTYNISGGQRVNGRVWDVTLRGGGQSETVSYTITGASSVAGSVSFRVYLTAAMNPPNTAPPEATIEMPKSLMEGLVLEFQTERHSS